MIPPRHDGGMEAIHADVAAGRSAPEPGSPRRDPGPDSRVVALEAFRRRAQAEANVPGTPAARLRAGLAAVAAGLGELAGVDEDEWDSLDADSYRGVLERLEQVRRMVEEASVTAAGRLVRSNPFCQQGFLSAKTSLQHMLQLSGPEAFRRVQSARLHARRPEWAGALGRGEIGVAQSELMARVAANPRVPADLFDRDQATLLAEARTASFDEFERGVRAWEALADPDGDRVRNERAVATRDVTLRGRRDGYGWLLDGRLGELDGGEVMEILGWFIEAEWRADWADANDRRGDTATTADLARSDSQRRADAFAAMARAAASALPDSARSTITTNVLIDEMSWETHLGGGSVDPSRFRDVVCRTQRGRRLHRDDAVNAALVGHIRRVVYDETGTVIDLGRRSRLFRGSAKDAVMLLADRCAWIGCDRPVHWCQADHSQGWKAHGATVPRNGGPLCGSHNRLKERGFRVHRDDQGTWHVYDPDGNEVT